MGDENEAVAYVHGGAAACGRDAGRAGLARFNDHSDVRPVLIQVHGADYPILRAAMRSDRIGAGRLAETRNALQPLGSPWPAGCGRILDKVRRRTSQAPSVGASVMRPLPWQRLHWTG